MYTEPQPLAPEKMRLTAIITTVILVIVFIALLFLFWHIQVVRNHHFKSLAMKNIHREKVLKHNLLLEMIMKVGIFKESISTLVRKLKMKQKESEEMI